MEFAHILPSPFSLAMMILVNLGLFFEKYVIFPCESLISGSSSIYGELCPVRKYRGQTPGPRTHPSRPSFEKHWEDMKAKMTEAPKSHRDAKNLVSV